MGEAAEKLLGDGEDAQPTPMPVTSKPQGRAGIVFTIMGDQFPENSGIGHDVVIGLIDLDSEEEIDAIRRSNGDASRTSIEMAKFALRQFDGKRVKVEEMEHEALWERIGSKVRNLVVDRFLERWAGSKEAREVAKSTTKSVTLFV